MSRTIYSPFSGVAEGTTKPVLTEQEIVDIAETVSVILEDGVLSAYEKNTYFVNKVNELYQLTDALIASAAEFSVSSTALSSAKTALNNYLVSLTPSWNNVSVDTTVDRTSLNSLINTLTAEIANIQDAIVTATGASITNVLTVANSAITQAAGAQATADGKVTTYYQNDPPIGASEGDLWIDTNDGNKLYRFSGASWVEIRDTGIAQAIANAATAQSVADSKIVSFYQNDPPSGASEGDLWIDTNDENKLYRRTGGAWSPARDAGILVAQSLAADAASAASAAQASANAANTAIYNITADNILSRDEKPEIRKQRDAIIAEYPVIRARAVALSVSVTNYDADYTALTSYLGGLDLAGATDTAITRTTFNTFFTDYYAERQTVLDGIAAEAAKRATVAGAEAGLINANVPLGNVNRLPFTRFEGSRGWAGNAFLILLDGRYFIALEPSPTAPNQDFFFFNTSTVPVIPGERLSVSSRLQAFALPGGATPSFWNFYVDWLDASGGYISSSGIANGTSGINEANRYANFFNVPTGASQIRVVLQYKSSGAGPVRMAFLEPMIASATADQAVHPPYAPGPNASDGADPNNLITVDGSGVLSGIGTGGVVVDNNRVPLGGNAVVNSEFTRGKFGWRWRAGTAEGNWGVNLTGSPNNYFGQRNVMWAVVPGTPANGANFDLSPDTIWAGGPTANAPLLAMPVVSGDRLFASVLAAPHRCTFQLWILQFDASWALVGADQVTGGTPGGAANGDPANFTRISRFSTANLTARWAIPMMRMITNGTDSDPYIFFTEPMLSKVPAGQTATPPYVPGRSDPNADVTAQAQVTTSQPTPFQIQADSSGVTTTDLSTQTRSITLFRGGVAQTSGVTVGSTSATAGITIASATVSGGIVTVTLSAANASGSVTINVVFGGVTYPVTIPVQRTLAAPVAGGSGSQPFIAQNWVNVSSTSYAQVTPSGATVLSTSGGQLAFSYSAQYYNGQAQCKCQYSLNGTVWFDVAGTEVTGSGSINVPGEEEPGSISRSQVIQSGLDASTLYYVRLVARRTSGSGTLSWEAPTFTAKQP